MNQIEYRSMKQLLFMRSIEESWVRVLGTAWKIRGATLGSGFSVKFGDSMLKGNCEP